MDLSELSGIGPKTEALFAQLGVTSCEDLFHYYPIHYDSYTEPKEIASLAVGVKEAVCAVVGRAVFMRKYGRLTVLTTEIDDPSGKLRLVWYNAPFMRHHVKKGQRYVFRGRVARHKGVLVMEHPEVFSPAAYDEKQSTMVPVYGLTKGLTNNTVQKAIRQAFAKLPSPPEYLPEQILRMQGLWDESEAIYRVHFPTDAKELEAARRRIVFDEFFLFILTMRTLKAKSAEAKNHFPMQRVWESEQTVEALPFPLTKAQRRVWQEIEADLVSEKMMSRLVQGDVGSGKTILAFLAAQLVAVNHYQTALMAPTEVLAKQHYENLLRMQKSDLLRELRPVLLTGSLTKKERTDAYAKIADGSANLVIGTHALIEDAVSYHQLALVITDEQHRFGVYQRRALAEKGHPPNMMVMSATPIPRTLGVIYYGDLDISLIDELPAKRLPIKNTVVGEDYRRAAMKFIRKEMDNGHQAYIICPMVEPSEEISAENVVDYTAKMKEVFADKRVEMLHGRMKAAEKTSVMEAFAKGEIDLLVSTTVVEVGVDVPNATVMMIENAERFGLATLHQLRGRVGRGEAQSYCIFMRGQETAEINERLSILEASNDGFAIAEKDFSLRGPGDLLGIRQSGEALFLMADPLKDRDTLIEAGETAAAVYADDPALLAPEHALLREAIGKLLAKEDTSVTL